MPPYTTLRPAKFTSGWSSHIFWLKCSWAVLRTKLVHIMCSSETVRPRGCTIVSPGVKSSKRLSSRVKRWRSFTSALQEPLRDHLVLDLGGALEDAEDPRVAPEALRGELPRVAVAAEDLHRLAGDVLGHLRAEGLGHPRFQVAALAGVLHPGRVVGELPPGLDLRRHVRELVADYLELADRLAELRPLLRIAQRRFERGLRPAHRARRGLDARDLVGAHQLPESLPLGAAQQILGGNLVAVELQGVRVHPLVPDGRDDAAGELRRMEVVPGRLGDEEDGDPVVLAGRVRVGDHGRAEQMGLVRPGAPGLLAADQVLVALLQRPALDPGRVA